MEFLKIKNTLDNQDADKLFDTLFNNKNQENNFELKLKSKKRL